MKNSSKQIDRKILKTLEPLNQLNPILLDELAAKSIVDEIPADKIICRYGENDSRQIYLLSGQIEIVKAGESKTKIIKSKSPLKTPLAEGSPRTVTLKTKTASTLLYIDADLLELLMSDEPELNPTYEVTEITTDGSDDWMLTFLQSPAFLQLPTENIQKLLTHMEEIPAKKDQVIITQAAKDDNYYIIKSGSCNVHRQPYKGSANILLATLPTGSGFGEEALISNGSRNATITMRENGSLMRLKKKDFLSLLVNPLIKYFEHSETQAKLDKGCVVIDVRSEQESKQTPLEDSVNIPLSMLRVKFGSLNADREYLLVCDDGSQSAAAAFLMIQNGLKCSVLKGGMNHSKNSPPNSKTKPEANQKSIASTQIKEQTQTAAAIAQKQIEQIALQQEQIKAAREKAEQEITRRKKELAESRARIAKKNQPLSSAQDKTSQLKEQTSQELAKAKAESKAIELHREGIMKKSAAAAEKTRKQAEEEAALIKQRAKEEAERMRAEKASQDLAKAEAQSKAIEQQQRETNAAMQRAEEMMKQSTAATKKARKQAEEAILIKQRAIKETEYLRAEVEIALQKMEQNAARVKEEEKRKHAAVLASAKKQADKLTASKTQQAAIETEAARVIEEKVVVDLIADENVDYKAISIPGMSAIEPINDDEAKRKAEAIKAKLAQSQKSNAVLQSSGSSEHSDSAAGEDGLFTFQEPENVVDIEAVKIQQPKIAHRTRAESELTQISIEAEAPESAVISPQQKQGATYKNNPFLNSGESQGITVSHASSPGHVQGNMVNAASNNTQHFNKQAYIKHQAPKSNTFAIAASFLLILAGAVFTLHATNTLKIQSIAALFNSGNDTVQPAATAITKTKTVRKKVLRADTKVNVKKKVTSKIDDIMQDWQNVLKESKKPARSQNNQ